ncbi:MAG: peptidase M20, partial [Chitinophagaceae bacterium]|nr:peptidase M20 [Anaerolineae bacterium]
MNWYGLPQIVEQVIEQAVALQQIPAPTFQEAKRAAYLEAQFKALGLKEIEIDAMDNVYGLLPGQESATKGMMISAHTDTVFSAETNLNTRSENGLIFGPGLGDNSVGVA